MASLEQSEDLCREAIRALLEAELVSAVEIAGRTVELTSDQTADERSIAATWEGGSLHVRLRVRSSSIERSNAEDRGRSLGLQAFAERGQRELNWISFEWALRDSIRAGEDEVPLLAVNSYQPRKDDLEAGRAIQHLGPASRAMAERSGLGGSPTVTLGRWSLARRAWLPSPEAALEALCKLLVIKAHFLDRGTGATVEGAPLFSWSAVEGGQEPQPTRAGRLGGMRRMLGARTDHWGNLLEVLEMIRDSSPTEAALTAWMRERFEVVSERRPRSIGRLLVHTGLAREHAGRFELGTGGALLVERREPWLLYDALRRAYTGLDESLGFFVRNPGARASALRAHLNSVLSSTWEGDHQARSRAEWLATCGLVTVDGGRYFPTEKGKEIAATIEPASGPAAAGEEDDEEEAEMTYSDIQEVRLAPARVNVADLVLPPGIVERCCAALAAGKHLLLVGPPGTGKTTLAKCLAAAASEAGYCEDALTATASADWTTYDTIGGWSQQSDGSLAFREGVVTCALRERRWLVLDEVNRADIDKSFGELFTALAGGTVTTPYTRKDDERVVIGPDVKPYGLGPWFRLIATMNVRDKASLFRLSYAFLRRFAVIVVPALEEGGLRHLGEREAAELGLDAGVRDLALRALSPRTGLGQFAPLGPSLLVDVLRYAKARGGTPDRAIAEGIGMVVVPQLEGLADSQARAADELLGTLLGGDPDALTELRAQLRSNFPHVFELGG